MSKYLIEHECTQKISLSLLRIYVYAQIIQRWKTLLSKIAIRNFCARTQKTSASLLRICIYTKILQCWKTLLSETIIRNFCACTQKTSTSLRRICVYAQKIQPMIIIKSSNNPIVDVLRPAQKLQVWNTYIPAATPLSILFLVCFDCYQFNICKSESICLANHLRGLKTVNYHEL